MKRLIVVLCFILGNLIYAQQKIDYNRPEASLKIQTVLEPYVEEFIQEAENRGYYLRFFLMERVDYIRVHPTLGMAPNDDRIGVVGIDYRGFYVSLRILDDPMKLRLTVFHELGHLIKQSPDHTCDMCFDIMSGVSHPDKSVYEDPEFWKIKLDDYFNWLDKNQ